MAANMLEHYRKYIASKAEKARMTLKTRIFLARLAVIVFSRRNRTVLNNHFRVLTITLYPSTKSATVDRSVNSRNM